MQQSCSSTALLRVPPVLCTSLPPCPPHWLQSQLTNTDASMQKSPLYPLAQPETAQPRDNSTTCANTESFIECTFVSHKWFSEKSAFGLIWVTICFVNHVFAYTCLEICVLYMSLQSPQLSYFAICLKCKDLVEKQAHLTKISLKFCLHFPSQSLQSLVLS